MFRKHAIILFTARDSLTEEERETAGSALTTL